MPCVDFEGMAMNVYHGRYSVEKLLLIYALVTDSIYLSETEVDRNDGTTARSAKRVVL